MISFQRFTLSNGLKVIYHRDETSPVAAFNMLYNVGARDEDVNKTGFAHLFEHLMFGGSANIKNFDSPLQLVGGQSNAFTSNDITNYYMTLPAVNLETSFWLESDRLNMLSFSDHSLEIQRKVVIEEFKQRYLNQPYGDVWLLLRPLSYKIHPYKWSTIGEKIEHIEDASMQDVKTFFFSHYSPNNAILSITANLPYSKIQEFSEKWFAPIESRKIKLRSLPKEPQQKIKRELWVERDVPNDAIYITFHMDTRSGKNYHCADLISDLLSNGKSSRFYTKLVKGRSKFIELSAFIMGSLDNGLFVIAGKPANGVSLEEAYRLIRHELTDLCDIDVSTRELNRIQNKIHSSLTFQEISNLNKAMSLGYYELFDRAESINDESNKYRMIEPSQVSELARSLFRESNSNVLFYKSTKNAG